MSPEGRTTVARLLDEARAGLERLQPAAALEAQRQGAALIDIRYESQRARDGLLPARPRSRETSSSGALIRPARTATPSLHAPIAR
jgi:hypothetical protein